MIYCPFHKCQIEFQKNLSDWCSGGPRKEGWTRAGKSLGPIRAQLVSYRHQMISIDETLAKNLEETKKWHLAYLESLCPLEESAYYKEYLRPRYDHDRAVKRAMTFCELKADIQQKGILRSVWIADISPLNLGFRYFRFNGCHRICAAKSLGHKTVPAWVFSTAAL